MKLIIEVTLTAEGARLAVTDPKFSNRFEAAAREALRDDAPDEIRSEIDGRVPFARAVTVKARNED